MPLRDKEKFDFGFEKVSAEEKTKRVTGLFKSVASRYDLMNDIMSLGLHRSWKTRFVESLPLIDKGVYLDVASGTADIAQALYERLRRYGCTSCMTASDMNPAMIEEGKNRRPHLSWICANAENLPLKNDSVDVYTIAFGLRNVTYKEKALQEAFRVLRPGGTFACLEFSQVSPPLQDLYSFYTFNIIPKVGAWIAGDEKAYQYLSESIATFMSREELLKMMKAVGFENTSVKELSHGVVALHRGSKL